MTNHTKIIKIYPKRSQKAPKPQKIAQCTHRNTPRGQSWQPVVTKGSQLDPNRSPTWLQEVQKDAKALQKHTKNLPKTPPGPNLHFNKKRNSYFQPFSHHTSQNIHFCRDRMASQENHEKSRKSQNLEICSSVETEWPPRKYRKSYFPENSSSVSTEPLILKPVLAREREARLFLESWLNQLRKWPQH